MEKKLIIATHNCYTGIIITYVDNNTCMSEHKSPLTTKALLLVLSFPILLFLSLNPCKLLFCKYCQFARAFTTDFIKEGLKLLNHLLTNTLYINWSTSHLMCSDRLYARSYQRVCVRVWTCACPLLFLCACMCVSVISATESYLPSSAVNFPRGHSHLTQKMTLRRVCVCVCATQNCDITTLISSLFIVELSGWKTK